MNFESYEDDYDYWNEEGSGSGSGAQNMLGFRNIQYSNAYGNYMGGYGSAQFRQEPGPPLGSGHGMEMMPRGPRSMEPPTTILGRGFGPEGPSKLRPKGDCPAIRYLVRCGIPKHNLKQLPNDLLELIEPQYCGLCGHSFDSFALSRVHYVSKNHQKAQKKWLAQNNNRTGGNNQEAPLRARELYCELCDVQITSKVHADSHYKGKNHLAVVERRKYPKNPSLLQPGMERRFLQLIRREKKFLSKAAETAENEEGGDKEAKEAKPLQPELYCEICKTNVTCSEQMTAHLNGKKHLTKEKNFILKSMRGELNLNEGADADAEMRDDDEYPEETENPAETENPDTEKKADEDWQEHWE